MQLLLLDQSFCPPERFGSGPVRQRHLPPHTASEAPQVVCSTPPKLQGLIHVYVSSRSQCRLHICGLCSVSNWTYVLEGQSGPG